MNKITEFKVKKCLRCGAETTSDDEQELFCSKCGAPVVNRCSDYNCDKLLKGDAKFCKHCGASSIFYNYGLLSNAPSAFEGAEDLPF